MAQNENYSQVDLRVGTEEQFNAKVGTLPAGTLFGVTDSTVSKADLSTDLKNEINGKINKPANPTSDSAITINSSGTISTKPLSSITGKTEVAVQSTTPTGDEILWINPNGTSGGGGSSGGGKLYRHNVEFLDNTKFESCYFYVISSIETPFTKERFIEYIFNTYGARFESFVGDTSSSLGLSNPLLNKLNILSVMHGELIIESILTYYLKSDTEIAIKRYANTLQFESDTLTEL